MKHENYITHIKNPEDYVYIIEYKHNIYPCKTTRIFVNR